MSQMTTIIILGVIVLVVALSGISILFPSRRIKKNLADRDEIDVDAALSEYFSGEEIDLKDASEIWRLIAREYNVAPGLLRLTDRFDVELDPKRIMTCDDELAAIEMLITDTEHERGISVNRESIKSLGDCIDALSKKSVEPAT